MSQNLASFCAESRASRSDDPLIMSRPWLVPELVHDRQDRRLPRHRLHHARAVLVGGPHLAQHHLLELVERLPSCGCEETAGRHSSRTGWRSCRIPTVPGRARRAALSAIRMIRMMPGCPCELNIRKPAIIGEHDAEAGRRGVHHASFGHFSENRVEQCSLLFGPAYQLTAGSGASSACSRRSQPGGSGARRRQCSVIARACSSPTSPSRSAP